jgi:hypothetical protein
MKKGKGGYPMADEIGLFEAMHTMRAMRRLKPIRFPMG